jgi:uncharacterized protein YjbI with pentapeptide repeats
MRASFGDDCGDGAARSNAGPGSGRDLAVPSQHGAFLDPRQLDTSHSTDRHRVLRRNHQPGALVAVNLTSANLTGANLEEADLSTRRPV